MKYKIKMKDDTERIMTIIDLSCSVDLEISKWPDADDVFSAELIEE